MRLPLSLRYSLSPRLLPLLGLEPESDIGPGLGPGLGPGSGPAGDVILEGCGVTCEPLSSSFDVD